MSNIVKEAIKDGKEVRQSILEGNLNSLIEGIKPEVKKRLSEMLDEDDSLFPSNFDETTQDDTLASKNPDSSDSLEDKGDGAAKLESTVTEDDEFPEDEFDVDDTDDEFDGGFTEEDEFDVDDTDDEFDGEFTEDEDIDDLGDETDVDDLGDETDIITDEEDLEFDPSDMDTDETEVSFDDDVTDDEDYEEVVSENIRLKKRLRRALTEKKRVEDSNKSLLKAVSVYKGALKEAKLSSQKLVLASKLFSQRKLDDKTKKTFAKQIQGAKSLTEAKNVYIKFLKNTNKPVSKIRKMNETRLPSSVSKTDSTGFDQEMINEWAIYAGIK